MKQLLQIVSVIFFLVSCGDSYTEKVIDETPTKTEEQEQKENEGIPQGFCPDDINVDIFFTDSTNIPIFGKDGKNWNTESVSVYYIVDGKAELVNGNTSHITLDNPSNFWALDNGWCRLGTNDRTTSEQRLTLLKFPDQSVDTIRCQVQYIKDGKSERALCEIEKLWYNNVLKYDRKDLTVTPEVFPDGTKYMKGVMAFHVIKK